MLTVGSAVVASKVIGQGMDPFLATSLRFALSLPVFLVLMRIKGCAFPRLGVRDSILLVAQAATGSVGYTILLINGLRLTSAADGGVIIGCLPAAAALTAVVVLGERLTRRTLVAVGLATAGVLMVASVPSSSGGARSRIVTFGDLRPADRHAPPQRADSRSARGRLLRLCSDGRRILALVRRLVPGHRQ